MAKKKQTQKGIYSLTGTSNVITINSSAMTHSIVEGQVIGNGGAITDMANLGVSIQQISDTQIKLERYASYSGSVTIHWQIVEYDSNVTVQRGSASMDTTSELVTISTVNLANTYLKCTTRGGSMPTMLDDGLIEGYFFDASTVGFRCSFPNITNIVEWQVVESPDFSVQSINAIASNSTYDDITISSVTTAQTRLEISYDKDTTNIDTNQLRGARLLDSTTVRLSAYASGDCRFSLFVISDIDITIQRGWTIVSSNIVNIAILTSPILDSMYHCVGAYSWCVITDPGGNIDQYGFHIIPNSDTQIALTRRNTTPDAVVSWEVETLSDVVNVNTFIWNNILMMKRR